MPEIVRPLGETRLDPNASINVPAMMVPCFRTSIAVERNIHKKMLLHSWGGIGDYVCAEPAFRYAVNNFHDTEITIASHTPEFFGHLQVKDIIDTREFTPAWEDYFVFQSLRSGDDLACQFLEHHWTHVVDYHSLLMFRVQLSPKDKCIKLVPSTKDYTVPIDKERDVVIHAGSTWPSRTFPKDWWDAVIERIAELGARPVLIGAKSFNNCGTVEVNPERCLDLRGKLSIMESVAATHLSKVTLTNDSSPLHFASSGEGWVGFISTVKRPDLLTHYRNGGEFGWRMQNHSLGGMWETIDMRPYNGEQIRFDKVEEELLRSWLPNPSDFAQWAVEKL